MRLQLVSDLHLAPSELDGGYTLPSAGADLVVFAGDIANGAEHAVRWAARQGERLGIPGVYVLGNHEYYHGVFPQALATAQAAIPVDSGLHLLECNQEAFGDVRLLGCTLWTDFALLGKERMDKAKSAAGAVLADYQGVITKPGGGKLRVRDTIVAHHQARRWLQRQLATTWPGKTVVVTHHGPHRQTAHPGFDDAASAGFVSHISELIRRHRIDLWVSGHTHYNHDFVDAGTRFVSNQRGYPGESVPGHRFDPALVIEI